MLANAITKLNFSVQLDSLREYYHKLQTDFSHLKWCWEKHGNEITQEWQQRMMLDKGTLLPYGWAIQSNLVDIAIPCPPYNISTHPRCEYRNTELAFGLVTKLQTLLPYTYRWSLVVQPTGGKVSRHVDQGDEYTGHIPIYEAKKAVFKFWNSSGHRQDFTMAADGSVYLVDTIIEHETENYDRDDRVGLVFRFKRNMLPLIQKLQGEIS